MRTVMLMRHAKSDWSYPELDDHDRPLNKRGKRNAPKMARFLKKQGLIPDLIVTSSATRALRTAQAVGEVCGCDSLKVDSDLYHATPEDWHDVLNQLPPVSTLLGVGHNPGLEDLLLEITGEYFRMKTGTVARLEFSDEGDSWDSEWTGSCVTYSPKELKE